MTLNKKLPQKNEINDVKVSWHSLGAEDVVGTLVTSIQAGLTDEEAAARLAKHGLNQLTEAPRPTFLKMVLEQLKSLDRKSVV